MNKNYLIIIGLVIVIVIAGIIAVNFFTNNVEYETLQLSDTCAVSVPVCNNSTFTENDGFKNYTGDDLRIISYNQNEFNQWENLGADIGLTKGLNQNFKYNHTHQGKNILIHPEENKTVYACLITNNTTGDVVIVASSNEEVLYHVIDSVNFTATNNNTNGTENTTNNAVKTPSSTNKNPTKTSNGKTSKGDEYSEGYIRENDVDIDVDGDGVGDGSAYHSHEYYVERGQTEPVPLGGG